jgi:phage terminase large subunit-like protein
MPTAGHGTTNDLVTVDEVWGVSAECFDDGLVPTTRARRSPLVSAWSTAGDESSDVMLRLREQGIRSIDTGVPGQVCLTEWSIPSGVDRMDRRWWRWANPSMGKPQSGLTLDVLMRESENPNRNAFLRAGLNCWVGAAGSWLAEGVWDECRAEIELAA